VRCASTRTEPDVLIGILSDSHGRVRAVAEALRRFDELGVEHVIHCGDVGGDGVFQLLAGRPCTFVWGNTDEPDRELLAYVDELGLPLPGDPPATLELDGKRLAVFHGHEPNFHHALIHLPVDYLFHGHTHTRRDERIINPGTLHRANPRTFATLDTDTEELTFHDVGG